MVLSTKASLVVSCCCCLWGCNYRKRFLGKKKLHHYHQQEFPQHCGDSLLKAIQRQSVVGRMHRVRLAAALLFLDTTLQVVCVCVCVCVCSGHHPAGCVLCVVCVCVLDTTLQVVFCVYGVCVCVCVLDTTLQVVVCVCVCVSRSVMSDSSQPHEL